MTAIQELIVKFTEARNFILSNDEYAKGYDGALGDCISVAESFIEKEKQQKEDFSIGFLDWCRIVSRQEVDGKSSKEVLEIYKKEKGL